jgi:hypothetical protein
MTDSFVIMVSPQSHPGLSCLSSRVPRERDRTRLTRPGRVLSWIGLYLARAWLFDSLGYLAGVVLKVVYKGGSSV